jgi:hypothetical protein
MLETLLLKWGIPTYIYNVNTVLAGKLQEKIGDTLEVTVGWVYGLSVNVDGVLPDNSAPLISSNIVGDFYLTLKYGQSLYVNALRLNHLVYDYRTTGTGQLISTNSRKYFPVNVPVNTDLKQSYYSNPLVQTGGDVAAAISLNLFYIDVTAYTFLVNKGIVLQNGLTLPQKVKQENG